MTKEVQHIEIPWPEYVVKDNTLLHHLQGIAEGKKVRMNYPFS